MLTQLNENLFKLTGDNGIRDKRTGKIHSEAVGDEKFIANFEPVDNNNETEN